MIKVTALEPIKYHGRQIPEGRTFSVPAPDAYNLEKRGQVEIEDKYGFKKPGPDEAKPDGPDNVKDE